MKDVIYQANLDSALLYIQSCLSKQSNPDALRWLDSKQEQIFNEKSESLYFMTFSAISNYFNNEKLVLTKDKLMQAEKIRAFWNPSRWSLSQLARTYLVLGFARHRLDQFKGTMDKLFNAADLEELIALYQALPLFPNPDKFLLQATNGIRSNMLSVFDAIALNSPYPAEYFDEIAWNQLVLKTLFVDSPIENVIGLKRRANPMLAKALINTARERFAANRPIKSELWCLVGLNIDHEVWPLLQNLLDEKHPVLEDGVILACDHCQLPEAKMVLDSYVEKKKQLQTNLERMRQFEQKLV